MSRTREELGRTLYQVAEMRRRLPHTGDRTAEPGTPKPPPADPLRTAEAVATTR